MLDKLHDKSQNELTLIIEGKEIIIESGKLLITMDTCANAFTCVMPWFPGVDHVIDDITAPYSYSECGIYIGGKLQMLGILYNVTHKIDENGRIKELEIFTKTADVIDSSVRFPFETNNMDLFDRCVSQMNSTVLNRQFDIGVVVDSGADLGGKFSRIGVKNTDNCFESLKKLAAQRGLLISCTVDGDLKIIKPNVNGFSVGTIKEDDGQSSIFEAKFSGRDRYRYYESIASSSKKSKTKKRQQAQDAVVTRPRFLTFNADDSLPGEALNSAEWKKNKSAADALSINFPVNSWHGPDNKLWTINTNVTVVSETLNIKNGFTFLITGVEFNYSNSGITAILNLKPPTFFTTGILEEPWN